MISEIIEDFEFFEVRCSHKGHDEQVATSLCIRPQCKEKSACCAMCQVELHRECIDHIVFFRDVPKKLVEISNLETIQKQLVSDANLLFQKINKALVGLSQPITNYFSHPGLTNLNLLGNLLRENIITNVLEKIGRVHNLISEFNNKSLNIMEPLNIIQETSQNQQQQANILPLNLIQEPTQSEKQQAEKLYIEFQQSKFMDVAKALSCIERAIQLVPNNEEYWMKKGEFLCQKGRYEEAIESCNKSIQIKPTPFAYVYKSLSLLNWGRLNDAIDCSKEGLQLFPNHDKLLQEFKRFISYLN